LPLPALLYGSETLYKGHKQIQNHCYWDKIHEITWVDHKMNPAFDELNVE